MRLLLLALFGVCVAGCESPCPGSAGVVTGSFAAVPFTLTCFQAFLVNSGGETLQLTGTAGNHGSNGSEMQITFMARTGCSFQSGQTVALSDPCSLVTLTVPSVGATASNLGLTPPLGYGSVPGPDTKGSYAISSWTTAAGSPIAITFSADGQLTFDSQTPGGPVGITGSASADLIQ